MSVFAQTWAWKFNIPSVPKFVLIALADQSDDDGEVRYRDVSAEFFSQKCGMTVRNFRRHIQSLELNGYLRRAVGGGRGNGTEFVLELGRVVSPLAEWQQPEIQPKEKDTEQPEETRTEMSGFMDEKPGQLRQETRTFLARNPDTAVRVSASIHNTRDQSTKTTNARGRARVEARASARSEDKFEFSIYRCRDWFAMELVDPVRMATAAKCVRRGLVEEGHGDHTGWWFEKSFITKARSNAAGMTYVKGVGLFPGTGPPDESSDDGSAAFIEPGGGEDDQSQACV